MPDQVDLLQLAAPSGKSPAARRRKRIIEVSEAFRRLRACSPAYFSSHHAVPERLSVRELQVGGGRSGIAASQVSFGILLARSASDRPAELGLLQGKAAVRCDTRTIKLWAVAPWHSQPGP